MYYIPRRKHRRNNAENMEGRLPEPYIHCLVPLTSYFLSHASFIFEISRGVSALSGKNQRFLNDLTIRKGKRSDTALVLRFIRELAEYEGIADRITATEESLAENLFGDDAAAETVLALVAEETVGFAVFYHSFSTILGRKGLHLDDLYIRPDWRGKGLGTTMLKWLASLAVERKCGRFEWWCMKNNTPALDFYHRIGAKNLDEVSILRLEGRDLENFASE